jgi:hypothetical protein
MVGMVPRIDSGHIKDRINAPCSSTQQVLLWDVRVQPSNVLSSDCWNCGHRKFGELSIKPLPSLCTKHRIGVGCIPVT